MNLVQMLTGGHPNSLGRTEEVVAIILKDKSRIQELYDCYLSDDEVVRLRVSSAFKRITKADPELMEQYIDKFLNEVSNIDQASAQWSIAEIMLWMQDRLSLKQKQKAVQILKRNIEENDDWIVLNHTMATLKEWSNEDQDLKKWLLLQLRKLSSDSRKSVAKRASKYLAELDV